MIPESKALRLPDELGIPTAFDLEFVRHDTYVRHRPIRWPSLRPDNRNQRCNDRTDAGDEICSLQNFGFANVAKGCVQGWLPSSVASERGLQKAFLIVNGT